MKQKHYKKPALVAVELDPTQTILQACKVGGPGGWLDATSSKCMTGSVGTTVICNTPVKGVSQSSGPPFGTGEMESAPS